MDTNSVLVADAQRPNEMSMKLDFRSCMAIVKIIIVSIYVLLCFNLYKTSNV